MLKSDGNVYIPPFRVAKRTTPKGGAYDGRGMERVCDLRVLNWKLDRDFSRQNTEPFGWCRPSGPALRERKPLLEVNWPAVFIYLGFVPLAWVVIIYFVVQVWR
jgi:hypothetical protein